MRLSIVVATLDGQGFNCDATTRLASILVRALFTRDIEGVRVFLAQARSSGNNGRRQLQSASGENAAMSVVVPV